MPWTFHVCIFNGSIHLDWHLIKKTNDNKSANENDSENDSDSVSIYDFWAAAKVSGLSCY